MVEIAPKAKPPVVKIIDFKKFKYEESKREKVAKKKTKGVGTKEIWLGPLISDHDLKVRSEQARTFLEGGNRVKLTVKFGGREIVHPEFGYQVLEKVAENLIDCGERDSEPRRVGRNLSQSLKSIKH